MSIAAAVFERNATETLPDYIREQDYIWNITQYNIWPL